MADIPEGQVSAASLIASGLASLERKDLDRAIADFSEAIKIDPKRAVAYRHRGNAYARKRDFKSAIADFNRAIAFAPNDAAAFYFRGRARHLTGELAGATSDYDKAIKLNPANLKAFQYREAILATQKTTAKDADAEIELTRTNRVAKREANGGSSNPHAAPRARANLSEKWQKRFALIEKEAGGTKLTRSETSYLRSFWGFFFSWFYYFFLGMRRKGFVLLGASVLLLGGADIAGQSFPRITHQFEVFAGLAIAIWVSRFVSRDYYAYIARGETMWPPLKVFDRPYAAPAFAAMIVIACSILEAPSSQQAAVNEDLPVAKTSSAVSAPQTSMASTERKPPNAVTAAGDGTYDGRDDNHPHRSPIADVAEAIVSAAKPQTWQTQAVKDQLTDEPRL